MGKSVIAASILLFVFSFHTMAQNKLWNKDRDAVKIKGAFLTIKKVSASQGQQKLFPPMTFAAQAVPFAVSYGNQFLKRITAKDENDYSAELTTINQIQLDSTDLAEGSLGFELLLQYYEKGQASVSLGSKYGLTLVNTKEALQFSLKDTSRENYIPVKTKRKYDYVLETFEFQVLALVETYNDSVLISRELKDLGSTKINRTIGSFRNEKSKTWNKGLIYYPMSNSKDKRTKINALVIKAKLSYANPYGLSQSTFNKFLEGTSETNEKLLKTLLIQGYGEE